MVIIPAFVRLKQENQDFKVNLSYIMKPCFKTTTKIYNVEPFLGKETCVEPLEMGLPKIGCIPVQIPQVDHIT
jgi:hypothetical protein